MVRKPLEVALWLSCTPRMWVDADWYDCRGRRSRHEIRVDSSWGFGVMQAREVILVYEV